MLITTNYLGVLIAALGSFAIGFLWFGPLFGKRWMQLMRFAPEHIEEGKKNGMAMPMILSLVSSFVTAFVFFSIAETMILVGLGSAMLLAALVWIAFILPPILNGSLWEGKAWGLFWLTSLQILASLTFMALVYTYWA